ncbi:MAG: hypothetical protein AAFR28_03655, partial [Pseudomonadota bacterium]
MPTTYWHYEPATGAYVGGLDLDNNVTPDGRRARTIVADGGTPPRSATVVTPDEDDSQGPGGVYAWDGSAWSWREDNRGVSYWTPADGYATMRGLG